MLDKIIISDRGIDKNSVIITNLTINNISYKIQPYKVDLITGNINKKGKSKILKPMLNTGGTTIPYVNLFKVDKKILRVNYYQLLTYLRLKMGLINKMKYRFIINKYLDYLDGHIDNLLYLDGLESIYYRDRSKFNKYIKHRVCIIDPTYNVFDAISDGLIVVKPVNIETNYIGEFYIDTNGIIVNNSTGMYVKRYTNKLGYMVFTYIKGNKCYSRNIINILGRTFLEYNSNTIYSFKYDNMPRSNTELVNIFATTRSKLTKNYHKNNTSHYDKYLKNYMLKHTKSVVVNNILFNSFKNAAMYIIKEEKRLGITRSLTSVVSLISVRINNKLKNNNSKIYNRYAITKGG